MVRKKRTLSFNNRLTEIRERVLSFFRVVKRKYILLNKWAEPRYRRTTVYIKKRPFTSFFVALFILLLTIFINNLFGRPPKQQDEKPVVKEVSVYRIGKAPQVAVSAQIQKTGVVKIVAQTAGVVSYINFVEGQEVPQGAVVMGLSQNYAGGNSASVSRQLAQLQYTNVKETYDSQKDILKKQREIAEKTDANADQLRDITNKSNDETNAVITLNDQILSTIDSNLAQLESTNVGGANDGAILSTKQLKSQLLAGNTQLKQASRSAQFQGAGDKPPAELSNLQKDVALKQLEIQEKALNLSKESARLQLLLAQMGESIFFPTAPFTAVVERVHVVPFQSVTPGTPLITLSSTSQTITAVAKLPKHLARNVSRLEESAILIGRENLYVRPQFISTEATDGQLYSVVYQIPDIYQKKLSNEEFIRIEIPIGYPDTSESVPFLPLDSIFQTQDGAYIFIVEKEKVVSRKIQLGNVFGRFVEVKSGLKSGDQVVLTRNVVDEDKVKITN